MPLLPVIDDINAVEFAFNHSPLAGMRVQRIAPEPELQETASGVSIATYLLANRNLTNITGSVTERDRKTVNAARHVGGQK
jgi:hypothetical protein